MPALDPSHASVRASDTTMNGHPDDSEEEVYLSEAASTGEPEDVKTDDDYEYHEGEESGSEQGYGDAQSQGASAAGSPSNKLPFDLSSIIRDLLIFHLDDLDDIMESVKQRARSGQPVSKKEFKLIVQEAVRGKPMSKDESDLLFRVFDTNKEGLLELSEMVRIEEHVEDAFTQTHF